jgi:hypothetical protein
MKWLVRCAIAMCLSAWTVFAAGETFDDAAQCPDKASHRGDIVKCFTFDEQLDACSTGRELACAVANGYEGALKAAYAIRRSGDAAVGGGYLEETTTWGSSGSFMTYALPSGQREFSLRYYQRWGGAFMDYPGGNNHTMAVGVKGNTGPCANILHIDGDLRGHIAINHSCNPGVVKLWDDDLFPGRWYLIEFYGRMETSCRDNTRTDGCNGYFAVYLDGVKKLERTNWNWGGGSSTATFDSLLLPRAYYQAGFPSWQPRMAWDNIVVGNDADIRIGAATRELDRGVAGRRIYYTSAGADPFMFRTTDATRSFRPQGDCGALPGVSVGFVAEFTRGLLALDALNSNARDWLAATRCTYPGPVIDGSIKLSIPTTSDNRSGYLTSDIDNVIGQRNLAESGNDSFIGGSIYLHSANVYSDRPILAGHMSGGAACRGMFCQWIGVTIDGGRWALGELFTTDSQSTRVFGIGPPATPGEWHSFEVGVMRDGYADLWVDGVKVISRARIPSAPGGATNKAFVGVSHLPTRTQPFAVNFDDIYWANVSREACYRDWGADCPADRLGSSRPPRSAAVRPLPPSDVE